jgi:hypothetical protein
MTKMKLAKWGIMIGLGMGLSSVVWAQNLAELGLAYQQAMGNYRTQIAQFDRDKQIYANRPSQQQLQTTIAAASVALESRKKAVVDYCSYLQAQLQNYVADEAIKSRLIQTLAQKQQTLATINNDFSDQGAWYQADANFARDYAALNETAYQSYAQIYWHELDAILTSFETLYRDHQQRILDEASSQVERERKSAILGQTGRSLTDLRQDLALARVKLVQINSRESYVALASELNVILAAMETSLKQFANLE